MPNSRIPESAAKFNGYIQTTDTENTTTDAALSLPWWTALGITSTNQTDWSAKRTQWNALYALYLNAATRTAAVNEQVNNFIRDFKTFANPLLDIMAASPNATEESEHIYRFVIKKNRKQPTRRTTKITDNCYPTFQSIGGGDFLISCRNATDTKRPSLPDGVDGVMIWYKIVGIPPSPVPIVFDNTWQSAAYSTARFVLDALEANAGKWIYIAAQWTYSPNAGFNSPISTPQAVLIV